MKEEGGLPVELCGLDVDDPDSTVSALDSSIRDGIKPRIPGVVVWPVRLDSGKSSRRHSRSEKLCIASHGGLWGQLALLRPHLQREIAT